MVKGIGIDSTSIAKTACLVEVLGQDYLKHVYSSAEIEASSKAFSQVEYLAARFAVKEAVFKALAHLTPKRGFDMQSVETLNESDGSPKISENEEIARVLRTVGVEKLFVSITTEGDAAIAVVVAEG
jgi:phosphopantetheine--protein transferase-like protein